MHRGYIKTYRKILEWQWFKSSETVHLFLYLLAKANFKDSCFMGHEIKRGDLVFGRQIASVDTGISERTIRTCLARLEQTNEITRKSTSKFSVITICNYETYQSEEEKIDQRSTSNRPAIDQQSTTSKEFKNDKNDKKKNKRALKHPFEESPYFDKKVFKDALPDWTQERLRKYYDAAITYSGANGGRYLDWILAVKNWYRKDCEENGIIPKEKPDGPPPLQVVH
jgi:hypothetical protein